MHTMHISSGQLNEKHPDANYSAASIARNAILARIEELEKEL